MLKSDMQRVIQGEFGKCKGTALLERQQIIPDSRLVAMGVVDTVLCHGCGLITKPVLSGFTRGQK